MTDHAAHLSDELLRRTLVELAGSPDSDLVLTDVLRRVDGRPQLRRRPWETQGWGRAGLILVAALLLAAAAATAMLLSPPEPSPPLHSARLSTDTGVVVKFTYQTPTGQFGGLVPRGSTGPTPVYSRVSFSKRLEVFVVTGHVHDCEHPAIGSTPVKLSTEPTEFLIGLRDEIRVPLGAITETTLGDLPAVSADLRPTDGACNGASMHYTGLGMGATGIEPKLKNPGRLIVARRGVATIAVLVSAATETELAEWMPTAQAYIDSMKFSGETP